MNEYILNSLGWIGVACILSAYAMNVFKVVASDSYTYLILNFLGSTLIVAEALSKKDYQPVFLNIIWALVALFMLFKLFN